jgi:hypothetical protein
MVLKFGKHKGQRLEDTPKSYQNWLLRQPWFKLQTEKPLHKQLNGWDGYGTKGQAIYDAMFEREKSEMKTQDCRQGICTCCIDSLYYGV